ncbi:hypothetical protein DPMN_113018 [Dreissena polymorpha]|uniref:Uncharacterized protein n=1 Tax=Dreissena polymorpha TaxID=45954 RepID=A0A9D4KH68_DREPO|nr:hypothetical protein DPMN_113018 [Dreissena polymorpha]
MVRAVDAAVTEICSDDHCSSRVNVCPRVVTVNKHGSFARIPIKLFNMSSKPVTVPERAMICE